MTENVRYCEVCGNANSIDAKFCRICGNQIGTHISSAEPLTQPNISPSTSENTVSPQTSEPTTSSVVANPPATSPFAESNASFIPQPLDDIPEWHTGGILHALFALLFRPGSPTAKSALLKPNSPKLSLLVYLNVIAVFIFGYVDAQHTTIIVGDAQTSSDPIVMASMKAILFLASFYIGSFVLGLFIKSSAIPGSSAQIYAQAIARKINAIRSMFFIAFNLINAVLIPTQPQYIYKMASTTNIDPTSLEIIQSRTQEYGQILVTVQTITYIISAFYLYIWLKRILKLRNGMPLILAILTIGFVFIYKNPAVLIS